MGVVTLTRRHVVLFWAIAAWLVVSYANFAKNLWSAHQAGEDRPTGYWVAHTVLIVVNLVIAVVLARLGWQAHRAQAAPHDRSERRRTRA
jgi:hypothetical protein